MMHIIIDSLINSRNSIVSCRCHHSTRYQRSFNRYHKTSGNTSALFNFDWLLIRAQWTVFYPMSRLVALVTTVICRYISSLISSTNFHITNEMLNFLNVKFPYCGCILYSLAYVEYFIYKSRNQ